MLFYMHWVRLQVVKNGSFWWIWTENFQHDAKESKMNLNSGLKHVINVLGDEQSEKSIHLSIVGCL